ncbi:MAG: acyl carrier protein [Pseudomonadota bacterium]
MSNTLQTVQRMVAEQFDLKQDELTPEATLESQGLDSLAVIEFMFHIEDEFKIKLTNERLEHIKTLQDVVDIIDRASAEQHGKA